MQFQVPQFIEVEDKLVGPLTFKQFVYLLGGAGASYIVWRLVSPFSTILAFVLLAPFAAVALALAFYKVNSRPFSNTLESGTKFYFKDRLYIWSKIPEKTPKRATAPAPAAKPAIFIPKLTESKLKDLAWSLDINEKMKQ